MIEKNQVAAGLVECEIEIKKSRFIATAGPAENREQAMSLLAQVKSRYPDARHHCWAYLFGGADIASSAAMNDDGEPSGTAGKPILNVLQHKGVENLMLIVTRYFGGVKLGAGGLVRAYSQAAEEAMKQLPVTERVVYHRWDVVVDFALEQQLRHFLSEHSGGVENLVYTDAVHVTLYLPAENDYLLEEFCAKYQLDFKKLINQ